MDNDVDAGCPHARIECMEEELAAEIQRYEHTLKIYNRLYKMVSIALDACSVSSLLLTNGTFSTALTGIGAAASISLGSMACLTATITPVLSLKKNKHRNTVRLARTYKSQIFRPRAGR